MSPPKEMNAGLAWAIAWSSAWRTGGFAASVSLGSWKRESPQTTKWKGVKIDIHMPDCPCAPSQRKISTLPRNTAECRRSAPVPFLGKTQLAHVVVHRSGKILNIQNRNYTFKLIHATTPIFRRTGFRVA